MCYSLLRFFQKLSSATSLSNILDPRLGMEHACPVYHNSLPSYLSDELETLQKRAMRIIHSFVNYRDEWTFPLSDKILKKIEIGKNITIA